MRWGWVVVGCVALAACGSGDKLSTGDAGDQLLAYQTVHCSTNPVLTSLYPGGGEGTFTTSKPEANAAIKRWLASQIDTDSGIVRDDASAQERQSPNPYASLTVNASYRGTENGQPVYLDYWSHGQSVSDYTYYDQVSLCWYVADKIEVLDITVTPDNPKEARVTFKQTERPSLYYRKAQADLKSIIAPAAFARADQDAAALSGKECVAELQRLDASGWRVVGAGC